MTDAYSAGRREFTLYLRDAAHCGEGLYETIGKLIQGEYYAFV